jgi:hypothetical protein
MSILKPLSIIVSILIIYVLIILLIYNFKGHIDNTELDNDIRIGTATLEQVKPLLNTGDIFLVRTNLNVSKKTKIMFNTVGGLWTHVGFVVRNNTDVYIVSSRHAKESFVTLENYLGKSFKGGINMHTVDDEINNYTKNFYDTGYHPKIGFALHKNRNLNININKYITDVSQNTEYRSSIYMLFKALQMCNITMPLIQGSKKSVICSEITAELMKEAGIIDNKDCHWLMPSEFTNDKLLKDYYNPICLRLIN